MLLKTLTQSLPCYSLEFNPIESAWGKMKERLKAKVEGSLEALEAELKPTLTPITAQDAQGQFRHAGYALDGSAIRFRSAFSCSNLAFQCVRDQLPCAWLFSFFPLNARTCYRCARWSDPCHNNS